MAGRSERGVVTLIAGSVASVSLLKHLVFVPSGAPAASSLSETAALRGAIAGSAAPLGQAAQGQSSISNTAAFAGVLGVSALGLAGSKSKQQKSFKSSARAFDPAVQEGVTEPFGFFDPMGFSKDKDEKGFRQLRVAEIKHGRVAMMASLGMVLPHFFKAPGFEDVPSGLGAVSTEMGGAGFAALFLGAGLHELVLWKDDENKDAGDFGDPFNFSDSIKVERNYELNNGRMAMFAVLGQIVAELVTGKDAAQQLGL